MYCHVCQFKSLDCTRDDCLQLTTTKTHNIKLVKRQVASWCLPSSNLEVSNHPWNKTCYPPSIHLSSASVRYQKNHRSRYVDLNLTSWSEEKTRTLRITGPCDFEGFWMCFSQGSSDISSSHQ